MVRRRTIGLGWNRAKPGANRRLRPLGGSILATALGAAAFLAAAAPAAARPVDAMLLFDTTGSMEDAIESAKAQVADTKRGLDQRFDDIAFAVADLRDYPFSPHGNEGDYPWRLVQPVTKDGGAIQAAIDGLGADQGGDGPESYGRALSEAALDPAVGWRADARRLVVLVADSVPHDEELNEGIPDPSFSSPFDTGVDPGRDEIVGTADDLDWQRVVLPRLVANRISIAYVLFEGDSRLLPYWEHWAGLTGGVAREADELTLGEEIADVIAESESGDTVGIASESGALTLSRRRRVAVRLDCPAVANAPCAGRVRLKTRKRVPLGTRRGRKARSQAATAERPSAAARKGKRRKRVTLAAKRFEISAGATRRVKLRLPRRKARLVRQRRRARKIRVIATGRDQAGNRTKVTEKTRLRPRAPRPRGRSRAR